MKIKAKIFGIAAVLLSLSSQSFAISWVGNFGGNDSVATVEGLISMNPLTQYKVDLPSLSNAGITLSGSGTSGTFSFTTASDEQVVALVLKAGPNFALYEYAGAMALAVGQDLSMEIWDIAGIAGSGATGLTVGQGNTPNISHLSIYTKQGTPPTTPPPGGGVPDSGMTLALLGLALVGLGFLRKRI